MEISRVNLFRSTVDSGDCLYTLTKIEIKVANLSLISLTELSPRDRRMAVRTLAI